MSCGVKIPTSVLKEYFDHATPAGKLYIAILLRKFDPKLGNDELRVLANDEAKIGYRDGCMILEFTVGQLSQLLAREESFKRFMASKMILTTDEYTDYARKIVSTEMVRDLSISQKFEVLPAFKGIGTRLIGPRIGPVPSATLKKLFMTATPAGKLYLAAIMQKVDASAGISALTELSKELTKVTYVSGAKLQEYSVAEIATELLRTGAFQDFDIQKNLSSK